MDGNGLITFSVGAGGTVDRLDAERLGEFTHQSDNK
jgi:hypothetical protein